MWVLLSVCAYGQGFYNSGQNIFVGENVKLVFQDNLINNGIFKNEGALRIEGDIFNHNILTNKLRYH